ncbi:MAG: 50S ribosomal protein L10 [Candidatus Hodgkinia cicadicola]
MNTKRLMRIAAEREQLLRLGSFIVLTAHAVSCNSVLGLKRVLRNYLAYVKFYKNASIKLALGARYPSVFGSIKGQHMFLIVKDNVFEVCKLVADFVKTNGISVHALVWAGAVCNPECVEFIASVADESALKTNVAFVLKRVLSRSVSALALPLTNFASLLIQKANQCRE